MNQKPGNTLSPMLTIWFGIVVVLLVMPGSLLELVQLGILSSLTETTVKLAIGLFLLGALCGLLLAVWVIFLSPRERFSLIDQLVVTLLFLIVLAAPYLFGLKQLVVLYVL